MSISRSNSIFKAERTGSSTTTVHLISISIPQLQFLSLVYIIYRILTKMLNLKHLSIICSILVVAIISMSACHCRVLQPNDLKLIEETCKRTPKPNLCLQLLKGDPRAPSADIAGLALILVDVIKAKANEAEKTIKQLLKQGGNKKALSECAVDYKGILILDIPQATRAVRGDPKFADDAVSDCAVEADICENRFNGKSPLTHVNNGMRDVANVARAIIRTLL